MMMVKIASILVLCLLLGIGYFFGEPKLKQRVAQMSCNEFLTLKPVSLEAVRGRAALMAAGGNMALLADNCAIYPGKPLAVYFGWHQYL